MDDLRDPGDPVSLFPFASKLTAHGAGRLRRSVSAVRVPAGKILLDEGCRCEVVLLVRSGTIRVFKTTPGGREITLYYVRRGEMCLLGISCLLSDRSYTATARAIGDVDALVVPGGAFRELFRDEAGVRQFVLDLFSLRLNTVTALVEEVAFRKLDRRLASFLMEESTGDDGNALAVGMTHEQIAGHLGTSREVVSRLLSQFEEERMVVLDRRCVRITDPRKLSELALAEPEGRSRRSANTSSAV